MPAAPEDADGLTDLSGEAECYCLEDGLDPLIVMDGEHTQKGGRSSGHL